LGKYGIFNNQLEQAGDEMRVELVGLAEDDQTLQKIAFTVDIAYGPMSGHFRFCDFNSQRPPLREQPQQFFINGADLIAQGQ